MQDAVLPRAPRRTVAQLRADVERALIRVDPAEAAARRKQARTGRRVDRPRPLPHEMAGLYAVLPAASAMRMHATLDAAARTARAAGDERSLDQLRADGLTDLVLHTSCAGDDAITAEDAAAHDSTSSDTTPDRPAGDGAASEPAARSRADRSVAGRSVAGRHVAGRHVAGRLVADPPVVGADGTDPDVTDADGTDPDGTDLDGTDLDGTDADGTDPDGTDPDGAVRSGTYQHRVGARGTACPSRRRPVTQIHVTVAMSTLIGLDDQPADLAGYGPVSAETARALAEGGVWRRLVTDPLSGAVLDLGRTRYRPTAALAAHVQARDRTCVQPSCSAPATSCDLDHTREFHAQRGRDPSDQEPLGTTSADNLGPLCHRDHLVKTEGGFRLRQRAPGEFVWVTPTGHVYEVQPGVDVDPSPGPPHGPPDGRPEPPDTRSAFLRSLPPPPGPDEEPPY